jgi:glutathionyl-hydroquinone reductase
MLNAEFNDELPEKFAKLDLYPDHLKKEIDEQNGWVYDTVSRSPGVVRRAWMADSRELTLVHTGQQW